jgi:phage FluMu protein Com
MPTESREIRCAGCGSLLAKVVGGALHLQRGDLQATFDGEFHASIVCYRARCRKLNVVRVRSSKTPER